MKYIINADDFGRTESVNKAILYGFDKGYLDRASMMVNMPFFAQALQTAREHGFVNKVGLHINLTSGYPLSDEIKTVRTFCNSDGSFTGEIFVNRRMMFFLSFKERRAVKKEIEAQIEKFKTNGFSLLHADSHGHIHTFPSLLFLFTDVLRAHSFSSIRIAANLHGNRGEKIIKAVRNIPLYRFNALSIQKQYFDALSNVLQNMNQLKGEGICEIMLHPNIWDGDIQIGEDYHYDDLIILTGGSHE